MGIDFNNTNQVLLTPEFFAINALEATHELPINDKIILKKVKAILLLDEVTKDYKSLLKSGPREFKKSLQNWNYKNRLLLYKEKIYIPCYESPGKERVSHTFEQLISNIKSYNRVKI